MFRLASRKLQELLVNSFTSRQMKAENSTWAKFTSCYDRVGGGGGRRRWQGWWYWHIVEWCSTHFSFSFSFPFLKFISISITILTALSKLVLLVSSTTYPSQSVKLFKIGIGKGGNLNWFFRCQHSTFNARQLRVFKTEISQYKLTVLQHVQRPLAKKFPSLPPLCGFSFYRSPSPSYSIASVNR